MQNINHEQKTKHNRYKEQSTIYPILPVNASNGFNDTLVQQSIHSLSLCAVVTESGMLDVGEDQWQCSGWQGRREHRLL